MKSQTRDVKNTNWELVKLIKVITSMTLHYLQVVIGHL